MNYNTLAPLYDKIMAHVKYDSWHTLINNITKRHFNHRPSILELGGGTGKLATHLLKSGYTYYGSDYSFAMCKEARKKNIPFFCADALSLPMKKAFDLVIFLYDSINYLNSLTQYNRLFKELYRVIDSEGYFLFDITTERNSETYFSDIVDSDDFGDTTYTRHSYYDKERKIQRNDFIIYSKHTGNNDLYVKDKENHAQRIFSVKEITETIPNTLYDITGIWDNFTFNRYNARSERIHFLLRKK